MIGDSVQFQLELGEDQYIIRTADLPIATWTNATMPDTINDGQLTILSNENVYNQTMKNITDPITQSALLMNEFAKVLYWTILTDLGQVNYNMLADAQSLMAYQIENFHFTQTVQHENAYWKELARFFNSTQPLVPSGGLNLNDTTTFYQLANIGLPHVEPAFFQLEYFCQVPKLKPAGSLIVTIAVADLVFLQALWRLLNWVTLKVLERRHPRAHYCAGCEEAMTRKEQEIEMLEGVNHADTADGPDDIPLDGESLELIRTSNDGSDIESGRSTVKIQAITQVAKDVD